MKQEVERLSDINAGLSQELKEISSAQSKVYNSCMRDCQVYL